jgi:hypothetical protein
MVDDRSLNVYPFKICGWVYAVSIEEATGIIESFEDLPNVKVRDVDVGNINISYLKHKEMNEK